VDSSKKKLTDWPLIGAESFLRSW